MINWRPLSHYRLRRTVDRQDPAPTVRGVLFDRSCQQAAGIAADVSQPGSPLKQADYPPEEDEASFPRDARDAEEAPARIPREGSHVPWEPWRPGARASYTPNPKYPRPPPGALTGGYVLADMPRGYPGARRVHLLILQEW